MDPADVDTVAESLYALAPADFIAARSEAVSQAKEAGAKEAAATIGKLPKPTVAAWLVNLLVREQHEQVEQFINLGSSLREAAESLDGDELRALNRQRRQIVLALVRQAVALGRAAGQRASSSAEDEIRETLEACLADSEVGAVVLAGRLAKSVQYAGFGAAQPQSPAGPRSGSGRPAAFTAAPPAAAAVPDLAALRRERAEQALADAERGLRRAERERDAEAGRLRAAEARRDELEAKVARVRSELADLEAQFDAANSTWQERQGDLAVADQALVRAGEQRSKAADEVARLTSS